MKKNKIEGDGGSFLDVGFFVMILIIFVFGGLMIFLGYETYDVISNYGETNETSYLQTLNNCNYNMLFYINQTPDYNNCQTQDECELKQLKLNILQQQAFQCMNESWESR